MLTRSTNASNVRKAALELAQERVSETQLSNGDESSYRNATGDLSYIGNFHKGLKHNPLGEIENASDYRAMVKALNSGEAADFEAIPLSDLPAVPGRRALVNPQAGLAFDLEGPDSHALTIPPAPRVDSAEAAAEMGELYWMALLRDVVFSDFETHADVASAASSLSSDFSDFRGPKDNGTVTVNTLFRGLTPGDLRGPFVSQFLLQRINYGTMRITQRQTS